MPPSDCFLCGVRFHFYNEISERKGGSNECMECLRDEVPEIMEDIEEEIFGQRALHGDNGNDVVNEEDYED